MTLKWSSYSVGCWIYWTWNLHVELLQLQPKMLVDGDVSLSSTSTFSAYKEPTPWRNTREKVTEWGKREASSILKRRVFHSQRRRVTAAERWEAEGYYFMFILVQKSLTKINKKNPWPERKCTENNRGFHRDREESGAVIMDTVVSHYHSR